MACSRCSCRPPTGFKSLPAHEIRLERVALIGSADYRSAIRPGTACSVRTTGAIDRSSVVGLLANHRSSIGASAARTIDTINASSSIGLMGYNKPAKHDDQGEREFLHACLPVEGVTMLPIIENEQPRPYGDQSGDSRSPSQTLCCIPRLRDRRPRQHWVNHLIYRM
jgi:hypothetical protein